jgi:crotonobetainyl-CoA:carnitine CoA-transferase CaiB-like acyl-CoA transferase
LCELLGFDDWKDSTEFNTNRKRSAQKGRLAERIRAAVLEYDFTDITGKLGERRIPYAPVNTPMGLVSEQHLNEAKRWLNLEAAGHKLKVSKLPIHLQETQDFQVRQPPSTIGHDTDEILAEAGYSAAEIAAFKAEKVVAATDRMFTDLPKEGDA